MADGPQPASASSEPSRRARGGRAATRRRAARQWRAWAPTLDALSCRAASVRGHGEARPVAARRRRLLRERPRGRRRGAARDRSAVCSTSAAAPARPAPGLRAAGAGRLTGVELVPDRRRDRPRALRRGRRRRDRGGAGRACRARSTRSSASTSSSASSTRAWCCAALRAPLGAWRSAEGVGAERPPRVAALRPRPSAARSATATWGHRDHTHLRWFTRRDIVALVSETGWDVTGVSHPPLGRSRGLDRLTRGRGTEFLVGQWYVAARAR